MNDKDPQSDYQIHHSGRDINVKYNNLTLNYLQQMRATKGEHASIIIN